MVTKAPESSGGMDAPSVSVDVVLEIVTLLLVLPILERQTPREPLSHESQKVVEKHVREKWRELLQFLYVMHQELCPHGGTKQMKMEECSTCTSTLRTLRESALLPHAKTLGEHLLCSLSPTPGTTLHVGGAGEALLARVAQLNSLLGLAAQPTAAP